MHTLRLRRSLGAIISPSTPLNAMGGHFSSLLKGHACDHRDQCQHYFSAQLFLPQHQHQLQLQHHQQRRGYTSSIGGPPTVQEVLDAHRVLSTHPSMPFVEVREWFLQLAVEYHPDVLQRGAAAEKDVSASETKREEEHVGGKGGKRSVTMCDINLAYRVLARQAKHGAPSASQCCEAAAAEEADAASPSVNTHTSSSSYRQQSEGPHENGFRPHTTGAHHNSFHSEYSSRHNGDGDSQGFDSAFFWGGVGVDGRTFRLDEWAESLFAETAGHGGRRPRSRNGGDALMAALLHGAMKAGGRRGGRSSKSSAPQQSSHRRQYMKGDRRQQHQKHNRNQR